MLGYNAINILILFIFLIPILRGILGNYTIISIQLSLTGMLNNIIELVSFLCSAIITRKIFFEQDSASIYQFIYNALPKQFIAFLSGNDILTYAIAMPIIYVILVVLLRLISIPINLFNTRYLSRLLDHILNIKNKVFQAFFRLIWAIPKATLYVLISVLLLSFYSYANAASPISTTINESNLYQYIYNNTLAPILNTGLAKKIPVIINDSFRKSFENDFSKDSNDKSGESPVNNIDKHKANVIVYFNGVTLDQAIKSNADIDKTAQGLTNNIKSSKAKAKQIYTWITHNIAYDDDKVKLVSQKATGIPSGSIEAYTKRKGICFDYSALFVSMCRASGLKVRLVTGMGYSGTSWGDHAWNQVYCAEEDRWINIDTTFGTVGNYFDNRNFNTDHRYGEIQGEW